MSIEASALAASGMLGRIHLIGMVLVFANWSLSLRIDPGDFAVPDCGIAARKKLGPALASTSPIIAVGAKRG